MKRLRSLLLLALLAIAFAALQRWRSPEQPRAVDAQDQGWTLLGWSDRGVYGMDRDYSVLAIQPPGVTLRAQLMDPAGGRVDQPAGITLSYEAAEDPAGSINRSSIGKTDFWDHARSLLGRELAPDEGLTGQRMPGAGVQPLGWDAASETWLAERIPITPIDDAGQWNPYPVMRLVARDRDERLLASTEVVLPVSDELACQACHRSGGSDRAEPAAGWVEEADPERATRLNVLRLHDERQLGKAAFQRALAELELLPEGLEASQRQQGRAVLCAACHASEPLASAGLEGAPELSSAMHTLHARERDPETGQRLDDIDNRRACYSCHPGDATQHLRGVMGMAVAPSGARAIQCESCHGSLRELTRGERQPWLDEPSCGSCHTGTATRNAGQIRYHTVWQDGEVRQPVDPTFATQADTPAEGLSLYRASTSHGGLYCAACHGATHAELPSREANDNLQAVAVQGHGGTLVECEACHGERMEESLHGPHGMHPMDASWARDHEDAAERDLNACRACHGADDRGTVLSQALAERSFDLGGRMGRLELWPGFQIGCYNCHQGPRTERATSNHPARVEDARAATGPGQPVSIALVASDPDGDPLTLRIVDQPRMGTVGLSGDQATYYPGVWDGSRFEDVFTFAAWDGSTDSNLGRVTIQLGHDPGPSATPTPHRPEPSATPVHGTQVPHGVHVWLPVVMRRQ